MYMFNKARISIVCIISLTVFLLILKTFYMKVDLQWENGLLNPFSLQPRLSNCSKKFRLFMPLDFPDILDSDKMSSLDEVVESLTKSSSEAASIVVSSANSVTCFDILARMFIAGKSAQSIIFADPSHDNLLMMKFIVSIVKLSSDRSEFLSLMFSRRFEYFRFKTADLYTEEFHGGAFDETLFEKAWAALDKLAVGRRKQCMLKALSEHINIHGCNTVFFFTASQNKHERVQDCRCPLLLEGSWLQSQSTYEFVKEVIDTIAIRYVLWSPLMPIETLGLLNDPRTSQNVVFNLEFSGSAIPWKMLSLNWSLTLPSKTIHLRSSSGFIVKTLGDMHDMKPKLNWSLIHDLCSYGDYACLKPCRELTRSDNRKDIAVFSYNFGNYRSEVQRLRSLNDTTSVADQYEWFFFMDTDPTHVSTLGFTACVVTSNLHEKIREIVGLIATNASSPLLRSPGLLLTKWFKFGHIPDVLMQF